MADKYQIVGECAHVVVTDHTGVSAVNLLYKGAFLPDNVDKDRLQHLLDTGLVAKVSEQDAIAPNAAVEQDPNVGIPPQQPAESKSDDDGKGEDKGSGKAELTAEQKAAQAKLPADGSAPDGRASAEVWVEYAVAQGLSREEAAKVSKDELRRALAGGK